MTTVEDIEKQHRRQRFFVRAIIAFIILVVCVFLGWFISNVGYKELHPEAWIRTSTPHWQHHAHVFET